MSVDGEPPRWLEQGSDAPTELRDLLQAGRRPLGTAQEIQELSRNLAQVLGPGAGLGTASAAAPGGKLALLGARSALWLALGAGGVAALWYLGAAGVPDAPPPAAPAVVARPPEPPAPRAPEPPAPEPPAAVAPVEPAPSSPPAAALPVARAARKPGASETQLLERAQAALAAQPARALQLATEHQRRFPDGALAEEREAIAIEALRRIGRGSAAQRRAAEFERRYPDSVHQQRVRGAPPAAR